MYTPTNETHLNEIALKVQSMKGVSESVEVLMRPVTSPPGASTN